MINASDIIAITIVAGMSYTGITSVADFINYEPIGMRVVQLDYADGKITQNHEIYGIEGLQAQWTAKIKRGDVLLCGGRNGGFATYDGSRSQMPVDMWVGEAEGACPPLKAGDTLSATWTWADHKNIRHSITASKIVD